MSVSNLYNLAVMSPHEQLIIRRQHTTSVHLVFYVVSMLSRPWMQPWYPGIKMKLEARHKESWLVDWIVFNQSVWTAAKHAGTRPRDWHHNYVFGVMFRREVWYKTGARFLVKPEPRCECLANFSFSNIAKCRCLRTHSLINKLINHQH